MPTAIVFSSSCMHAGIGSPELPLFVTHALPSHLQIATGAGCLARLRFRAERAHLRSATPRLDCHQSFVVVVTGLSPPVG
jgi:hypothetical protein